MTLSTTARTCAHECPVCGADCTSQEYTKTLMSFRSSDGHNHDDNRRIFYFLCDKNHRFSVRVQNTCPAVECEWKGLDKSRIETL